MYPTTLPTSECPSSGPTSYPTWSQGPSSIPSIQPSTFSPSTIPTTEPTFTPSSDQPSYKPTQQTVQAFSASFRVNQKLDNIGNCTETLSNDRALKSFISAIKEILSQYSRNSVVIQIDSAFCSTIHAASDSTSKPFTIPSPQSIDVVYNISYITISSTYTAWETAFVNISHTLKTAIADSTFTTIIRKYAKVYNVTGLYNVSSSSVTVFSPIVTSINDAPTMSPISSSSSSAKATLSLPSNALIGVLVAAVICLLVAIYLVVYVISRRNTMKNTVNSNEEFTTENPAKAKGVAGGTVEEGNEQLDVYKGGRLSADMQENPLSSSVVASEEAVPKTQNTNQDNRNGAVNPALAAFGSKRSILTTISGKLKIGKDTSKNKCVH